KDTEQQGADKPGSPASAHRGEDQRAGPDEDVDVNDTLPHIGGAGQQCLTNFFDAPDGNLEHAHMEKLLPQKRCQKAADYRGQETIPEEVHDFGHRHTLVEGTGNQVHGYHEQGELRDDVDLLSDNGPEIPAANLTPGRLRLEVALAN